MNIYRFIRGIFTMTVRVGKSRNAYKSAFAARAADESGQATVEYAVVLFRFLLVVVALALFISAAHKGSFVWQASDACAYAAKGSIISVLRDALLF